MHQQLTVFVADCAVVGVGRALLGDEGVELGAEVFDLRQARQAVLVEVSLCLAVLLYLVGTGVVEFARKARRLVLRKHLARLCVGDYMAAKLVDLGDPRVERRYAVFGGSKFFARNVGAGAEFFTAFNPVLLQIQQRFRHLTSGRKLKSASPAAARSV